MWEDMGGLSGGVVGKDFLFLDGSDGCRELLVFAGGLACMEVQAGRRGVGVLGFWGDVLRILSVGCFLIVSHSEPFG